MQKFNRVMYRGIHIYSIVFFFKQKTAYEMRISDWSSDVCSSDLPHSMTLPPRSRVSVKESVVNLLSFMRQLRLVFRMVGARANKDSELLAPPRQGLRQSIQARMPSPRFSSTADLKRRMRKRSTMSSKN